MPLGLRNNLTMKYTFELSSLEPKNDDALIQWARYPCEHPMCYQCEMQRDAN